LLGRNDPASVLIHAEVKTIDRAHMVRQPLRGPKATTGNEPALTAGEVVGDVLRKWPHAARVLVMYRMHCVGCAMAPF
jgi:hypothetical protein